MDVASRIKQLRKLKGLTQQELGLALGYSENTAGIRIAQYESGSRKPSASAKNQLSKILEVSPNALAVPNVNSFDEIVHILFVIEDECGFDAKTICSVCDHFIEWLSNKDSTDEHVLEFLIEWAHVSNLLSLGAISKKEYDQWRFNYSFAPDGEFSKLLL